MATPRKGESASPDHLNNRMFIRSARCRTNKTGSECCPTGGVNFSEAKGDATKFSEFLKPITVDEINVLTETARRLPPSGDQSHVIVEDGEDPWIIAHGNDFLYCTVDRRKRKILVSRFKELKEAASADSNRYGPKTRSARPPISKSGRPSCIVSTIDGTTVLCALNGNTGARRLLRHRGVSQDPQGEYVFKAKLNIDTDRWAIDGSILEMPSGEDIYLVGLGRRPNESQNIYIAEMSDPWTLFPTASACRVPNTDWEKVGILMSTKVAALINKTKCSSFIRRAAAGPTITASSADVSGRRTVKRLGVEKEAEPVFKKPKPYRRRTLFVRQGPRGQDWIVYPRRPVEPRRLGDPILSARSLTNEQCPTPIWFRFS
jgi:hypothetical protein